MRTLSRGQSRLVIWSALSSLFFFNDTATTEIYTLSLHDALPICEPGGEVLPGPAGAGDLRCPQQVAFQVADSPLNLLPALRGGVASRGHRRSPRLRISAFF